MLLTHQLPSSSSSQWSAKRTVIVNSYAASLSSPEAQAWPLPYFHDSPTPACSWICGPLSPPSWSLPTRKVVLRTALIFFHWRSSSALSLVSLKRLVFRPSDILMPYWNAALRQKRTVEARRHQRLHSKSNMFPEDPVSREPIWKCLSQTTPSTLM